MSTIDETAKELKQAEADEELKDRLEREHGELLEELRALIPGSEVLFGFLLAIRFTGQFQQLNEAQRFVYYGTLLSTAIALVMFLAPAARHRAQFREGDKERLVRSGNVEAIVGSAAAALALTGVLHLVIDLSFGMGWAAVIAAVFFAIIVWRWWGRSIHRKLKNLSRPHARGARAPSRVVARTPR